MAIAAASCPLLARAVQILESLAPTRLAGKWDNVGLLVESFKAGEMPGSYSVFFTNDLTPAVLDEALSGGAKKPNLIITYHPTPFVAMKKFSLKSTAGRVVLTCANNNVAVYSPHTAWDCVSPGLNDWLVEGVASELPGSPKPSSILPCKPTEDVALAATGAGEGRVAVLPAAVSLLDLVAAVKAHLKLEHLQIALPSQHLASMAAGPDAIKTAAAALSAKSFAVCAGSGASVLTGVKADVFITGEMSHHEVLAANAAGTAVLLTHHSKCERGYLPVFAERFRKAWEEVSNAAVGGAAGGAVAAAAAAALPPLSITISAVDADPLAVI